jgi:hypothetical protein
MTREDPLLFKERFAPLPRLPLVPLLHCNVWCIQLWCAFVTVLQCPWIICCKVFPILSWVLSSGNCNLCYNTGDALLLGSQSSKVEFPSHESSTIPDR